jgi:hypothetical protein
VINLQHFKRCLPAFSACHHYCSSTWNLPHRHSRLAQPWPINALPAMSQNQDLEPKKLTRLDVYDRLCLEATDDVVDHNAAHNYQIVKKLEKS